MARRDDDGTDRPKKSWSEIDKARDGKRGGGAGGAKPDRDQQRFERSHQYAKYKAAADKFFSGDVIPEPLADRVDPTGENRQRVDALKKLKVEDDFKRFCDLAKDFIEKHGMPEDGYVLDRLLTHPSAAMVKKSLEQLTKLISSGELVPPKSLAERLRSLELTADDPDVQDGAAALGKLMKARR